MFLRVSGNVFHSLGAAEMNARSPIVANVLKLGLESRNLLFGVRPITLSSFGQIINLIGSVVLCCKDT